jgi:hypothetical protein
VIGQTWKSEIRQFRDEKTGGTVWQLTSTGNNVHLYFTENSFDAHQNEIIFRSDRAAGEDRAPHEYPHYTGFKDHYYLVKDGRITLAYLDGSGSFDVFDDTYWLSHFQLCPVDSTLATFCHEGPWHLVTQRIWLLDFVSH